MAGDIELINSLTAEQARGILIYLSQNRSVAKKVSKLAREMKTSARTKAVCVQCSATFDPSDTAKNCFYHNGQLEADYDGDFWADHDEDCHGTIDTDEMREEFPEGFIWNCCDKGGDDIGCRWGRHQSDPNKVEDGEDADLYDDGWDDDDDDDDDLDDEDEDDKEEVADEDHGNKRSNGDESQDPGPNKRQKL
ncbi:hypothetical protein N5P37_006837 [Trichoderma harzianum]|uniref:Uncharacterized protein n=1 Tax=Trichoderma harzianum CBS 226.95 TaxID=983964 RepID=A0A2T4A2Q4_TRIHA|nr:hypothetical protein M431DRAFT_93917 [Trichoderma harzianum CBS 226.95]KAK0760642.1 hypothetical protein N5P37_006837 [Trichoderma harzianum]PKK53028.1 hypothetical protein CI102_1707 [Trichoderma harzianum]PTB51318.1 hypothetical protein M431DRAFT_93917 [Trichoderma harzianum CBS 226.95]